MIVSVRDSDFEVVLSRVKERLTLFDWDCSEDCVIEFVADLNFVSVFRVHDGEEVLDFCAVEVLEMVRVSVSVMLLDKDLLRSIGDNDFVCPVFEGVAVRVIVADRVEVTRLDQEVVIDNWRVELTDWLWSGVCVSVRGSFRVRVKLSVDEGDSVRDGEALVLEDLCGVHVGELEKVADGVTDSDRVELGDELSHDAVFSRESECDKVMVIVSLVVIECESEPVDDDDSVRDTSMVARVRVIEGVRVMEGVKDLVRMSLDTDRLTELEKDIVGASGDVDRVLEAVTSLVKELCVTVFDIVVDMVIETVTDRTVNETSADKDGEAAVRVAEEVSDKSLEKECFVLELVCERRDESDIVRLPRVCESVGDSVTVRDCVTSAVCDTVALFDKLATSPDREREVDLLSVTETVRGSLDTVRDGVPFVMVIVRLLLPRERSWDVDGDAVDVLTRVPPVAVAVCPPAVMLFVAFLDCESDCSLEDDRLVRDVVSVSSCEVDRVADLICDAVGVPTLDSVSD